MSWLVVGDGPLAHALAARMQARDQGLAILFLDELGLDGLAMLDGLAESDLEGVVEAVIGSSALKWQTINELEPRLPPTLPLLTATLNASATEVASWCDHPRRVGGFCLLPPLDQTTVVEIMRPLQGTDERVSAAMEALFQRLDLAAVPIGDSPGGVVPRVVCSLINEAAFALMEGAASNAEIDQAMRLGTSWPHGPLEWAALIGLDQVVGVLEGLASTYGPQYLPAPLLRQSALAGLSRLDTLPAPV